VTGSSFVLMHCTSSYPTPSQHANLSWIGELSARFGTLAGFSDHTTDIFSGALSVAAGACIIERHLTYDKTAQGPDHSASSDPAAPPAPPPPAPSSMGTCSPMPPKRRICFVTGTRAEFGLMQRVLRSIRDHPRLSFQLVVTGMHLDQRHGRSISQIAREFTID